MTSTRSRLLLGLLTSTLAVQVIMCTLIYTRVEDEIDDLFDAELERSALTAAEIPAQAMIPTPQRSVEDPREELIINIFQGPGSNPIYQSRPLGITRVAPRGFSKLMIERRQWRLFAATVGQRYVIAAQPGDVRARAARRITWRIVLPAIALLPLAAVMIWLAVAFGLRPLVRITHALRSRSHRDLNPIAVDRLPSEVVPLVEALNDLMRRLAATITAQRRFIADAAHELLTPLTALRLQAQMLARAKTPSRREETMAELQEGISRTLQLARQLLTLARQDGEMDDAGRRLVDLAQVIDKVLPIHSPLAIEKCLQTDLGIENSAEVWGNEEAITILISNLIDNSIKYSHPDGRLKIRLRSTVTGIEFCVEDSGPGIPPEERERVFDRFYRRSASAVTGNGLGLAIAREIATRHDASILLDSSEALGGLRARVMFPGHTVTAGNCCS